MHSWCEMGPSKANLAPSQPSDQLRIGISSSSTAKEVILRANPGTITIP